MDRFNVADPSEVTDQANPFVKAKGDVQLLGMTTSSSIPADLASSTSHTLTPTEPSYCSTDSTFEPLQSSQAWVAPPLTSPPPALPNPFSMMRSMSTPIGGINVPQQPMAPNRTLTRTPSLSLKTDVALRSSHTLHLMKTVSLVSPTMPQLPEDAEKNSLEPVMRSVVKVFCIHTEPNFSLPWQRKRQYNSFSSGFVVSTEKRWLLTNAHSVHYHSQVKVKKHGDDTKYIAKVLAVGADCDVALLTVENDTFWVGVPAVKFGTLPRLQDSVAVVGYPVGGDTVSVTVGVVSRLEVKNYSFGSTSLLTVQIDAAINSGNSGGPVFGQDNKCVGIAFESLVGAGIDGVGYIIPAAVVLHFIEDYMRNGHFTGFPDLGVRWQDLESNVLRKAHRLGPHQKGVLVRGINPTSPAHKLLHINDVIVRFDGVQVSNDGTIPFRESERVCFEWLPATKFVGDEATLDVLRQGEIISITVPLTVPSSLVPTHISNRDPNFLVVAGLVFTSSCIPYLMAEYRAMINVPFQLESDLYEFPENPTDQVVVLSQVLACEATLGYEDFANLKVTKFNDTRPRNLAQLAELVAACEDPFMWFELDNQAVIVIEADQVVPETRLVLQQHCIPTAMSSDLQAALPNLIWPPAPGSEAQSTAGPAEGGGAAEGTSELEGVSKAEHVGKPEGISKPEDIIKPEGINKPEDFTKPEGISKPEDVTKPEAISKPEDVSKTEGISKVEESTTPEGSTRPGAVSKPEMDDSGEAEFSNADMDKASVAALHGGDSTSLDLSKGSSDVSELKAAGNKRLGEASLDIEGGDDTVPVSDQGTKLAGSY